MLINSKAVDNKPSLPDVASAYSTPIALTLNWVGMDQIDLPLPIVTNPDSDTSTSVRVDTRVNCYVSLDNEQAKGIHMSRLYRALNDYSHRFEFTPNVAHQLLDDMIHSHQDLSCDAYFSLSFDIPLKRPALLSDHAGWKSYPVEIICRQQEGTNISELKVTVPYSSTCPCSASLSRQLLANKIRQQFSRAENAESTHNQVDFNHVDLDQLTSWLESSEGSVATPHSQRSYAYIKIRFQHHDYFPIVEIIDAVEDALKTPVQTAVKREDEQEFARLNGENLMFCEDAARRVKQTLMQHKHISDYWLKVEHQESLHPHNAVAIAVADIPDGFHPSSGF